MNIYDFIDESIGMLLCMAGKLKLFIANPETGCK